MDSTNRAHLSGALITTWVTRIDELEAGRRAAVLKALATAMPEPTRWQNRRTTANLMVTLSETPELCLDYGGHRFPEDYDIEAFRRFMIALCATPKQPVVPADIAALHWGTIGDDGESNKSRAAVARFLAPLLPPEPVAAPARPVQAELALDPIAVRFDALKRDLEKAAGVHAADIARKLDALRSMVHSRLLEVENRHNSVVAGINAEQVAARAIAAKRYSEIGVLLQRVGAIERRLAESVMWQRPAVPQQASLILDPTQRVQTPGMAPTPPTTTQVKVTP